MNSSNPTAEYIAYICGLYGDVYDDRIEDSKPPTAGVEYRVPGADWVPGQTANHKSLISFQKELDDMGKQGVRSYHSNRSFDKWI